MQFSSSVIEVVQQMALEQCFICADSHRDVFVFRSALQFCRPASDDASEIRRMEVPSLPIGTSLQLPGKISSISEVREQTAPFLRVSAGINSLIITLFVCRLCVQGAPQLFTEGEDVLSSISPHVMPRRRYGWRWPSGGMTSAAKPRVKTKTTKSCK